MIFTWKRNKKKANYLNEIQLYDENNKLLSIGANFSADFPALGNEISDKYEVKRIVAEIINNNVLNKDGLPIIKVVLKRQME